MEEYIRLDLPKVIGDKLCSVILCDGKVVGAGVAYFVDIEKNGDPAMTQYMKKYPQMLPKWELLESLREKYRGVELISCD